MSSLHPKVERKLKRKNEKSTDKSAHNHAFQHDKILLFFFYDSRFFQIGYQFFIEHTSYLIRRTIF